MSIRLFSGKQEREQFERLAAENERQVYSVCYHMMGNREDAQDCAQEAMLRAFKAFGSFRRDASFTTWITRIAMNACTDALRKRRPSASLDAMREETNFDVPDTAPTAYARLEQKERMRLLREGLDQLPEDMRQVIVLRDMRGMAYDEIAETLELPLGTVKSRVNRAREKLGGILQKSSELFSSQSV
ncbi:MAG: sigma-70 family RNA polymerase sigma factor [Clostridia bacterium]|nr:sigma-70 family RNA polymerase sigma factor [Clostridia bacterium]